MNNGSPYSDRAPQAAILSSTLSSEAILAQLRQIVSSAEFGASQQLCRFLTYIVEQTLLGKSEDLKAYTIALEVFERGADFNPQLDSVVRVRARHLRQALEHYYLTEGNHDPIRIDVPKGSYVPTFQEHNRIPSPPRQIQEKSSLAPPTAQQPDYPLTIAVLSLDNLSDHAEHAYFATGLTEECVTALMRFPEIVVIGPLQRKRLEKDGLTPRDVGREYGAHFLLDGNTQWSNGSLRVRAKLIDTATGVNLWAESYRYSLNTNDWFAIEDEVVSQVVATLADSFGVIPRTLSQDSWRHRMRDSRTYDATLRFHHAVAAYAPEEVTQASYALEEAHRQNPDHATILAMLADLHGIMFNIGMRGEESLEQADVLVRQALSLKPNHPHARSVIGWLYFLRGEADACVRAYEAALIFNPNHAYLLGAMGNSLALAGKWERGLSLVKKAMRLNPHYPGWYHFAFFFDHYRKANYEAALEEAVRCNTPGLFMDPLIRAAALGQLGHRAEARTTLQELLHLLPEFPTIGREWVRRLVFSEEHVEMLWDGLRKAGL